MGSDTEIEQKVIALLTVMTGATPSDVESDEKLLPLVRSAIGKGLANYQFTIKRTVNPNSAADIEAVTNEAAQQAAEQVGQQSTTALGYAMGLFCSLAHEFEASCPEFDVQEFLRRRGLELAGES